MTVPEYLSLYSD